MYKFLCGDVSFLLHRCFLRMEPLGHKYLVFKTKFYSCLKGHAVCVSVLGGAVFGRWQVDTVFPFLGFRFLNQEEPNPNLTQIMRSFFFLSEG